MTQYQQGRKQILYDQRALKELKKFPLQVVKEFRLLILELENGNRLGVKFSKKLRGFGVFELRVRLSGQWRGLYFYLNQEHSIIILKFFRKKTRKTPSKEIETALSRLQDYYENQK